MPKWLKIGGIGCAVLVLVGGLLLVLAVYQGVTCCGDFAAAFEEVQVESHQAAAALHLGDYERFHDRLDESVRQDVSPADLEAEFGEYRPYLDASEPFPIRIDIDPDEFDAMNVAGGEQFRVHTHFAQPRYEDRLRLSLVVETREAQAEDKDVEVRILDWETAIEEVHFSASEYAQSAERFYNRLQRQDFNSAHQMVARMGGGELAGMTGEEFAAEMQPVAERLSGMDRAEVQGVYPGEYLETVTVRMLVVEADQPYFFDIMTDREDTIYEVSEIHPAGVDLDEIDPAADEQTDEPDDEEPGDRQESVEDGDTQE